MLAPIRNLVMLHAIPPEELPSNPEEIDLNRVVSDPDYRAAVKDLLHRWIGDTEGTDPPH